MGEKGRGEWSTKNGDETRLRSDVKEKRVKQETREGRRGKGKKGGVSIFMTFIRYRIATPISST